MPVPGITVNSDVNYHMDNFSHFWQLAVDIVWGLPLVILITGCSVYFFVLSRMLPYGKLLHAVSILRGRYSRADDPGEISHFQSLSSALSGTIGMGNIAGVAIAISMGGAGAIFWMWVAGFLGMITKFFTCTLSCLYRYPDANGVPQGGPMYFIEHGLGKKYRPLAVMFSLCGMIGCMPLFQANQIAGLLQVEAGFPRTLTGVLVAAIVGIITLGGIRRIGMVTARIVPSMFVFYLLAGVYVILSSHEDIPAILTAIFTDAFGGGAVAGGITGLTFKETLVIGVKRAVFSNEAGVGTEAMAHGAARTGEPVREGLVAMLGPVIDTHIVCTITALVILSAGIPQAENGVLMASGAFGRHIPGGNYILMIAICLFAITTILTYSYYGAKCAGYLFGEKQAGFYIYFYLLLIPFAANWTQITAVNIIDTMFALLVIPTLAATTLLAPQVISEMKKYLERYQ